MDAIFLPAVIATPNFILILLKLWKIYPMEQLYLLVVII